MTLARLVGPVLAVARKDLLLGFRNRTTIVLAVLAPVVLGVLCSLAFGQFPAPGSSPVAVAFVDADTGSVGAALKQAVNGPSLRSVLRVHSVPTVGSARQLVHSGGAVAALVVPAGTTKRVDQGHPANIVVIRDDNQIVGSTVAESVASALVAQVTTAQAAVVTAHALAPSISTATLAARAAKLTPPFTLSTAAVSNRAVKAASYFGPSMALLFLFFTMSQQTRTLWTERRQKILARVEAAPVPPWVVVLGKLLAAFGIGLVSVLVSWGVMSLAFQATWGPPAAVLPLIVLTVVANLGLAMLVLALSKSEQQLAGLTALVGFGLAIIGGNFVQVYLLPSRLQQLALITPNGWALRSFSGLVAIGSSYSIATCLFVLLGFVAVTGAVATWRIGKRGLA